MARACATTGALPGDRLTGFALVDAHQHLALLHSVADVEMDFDDAAGNLGRHGRLPDRLDQRLGGIGLIHLTVLYRRSGKRQRRMSQRSQEDPLRFDTGFSTLDSKKTISIC